MTDSMAFDAAGENQRSSNEGSDEAQNLDGATFEPEAIVERSVTIIQAESITLAFGEVIEVALEGGGWPGNVEDISAARSIGNPPSDNHGAPRVLTDDLIAYDEQQLAPRDVVDSVQDLARTDEPGRTLPVDDEYDGIDLAALNNPGEKTPMEATALGSPLQEQQRILQMLSSIARALEDTAPSEIREVADEESRSADATGSAPGNSDWIAPSEKITDPGAERQLKIQEAMDDKKSVGDVLSSVEKRFHQTQQDLLNNLKS